MNRCLSCMKFNSCSNRVSDKDVDVQCSAFKEWSKTRLVMRCVNNMGLEEHFDIGLGYDFDEKSLLPNLGEPELVVVYDKFGQPKECFSDRFELDEEE